MTTVEIHIMGLVQGVGFRPFIYRIAKREGIKGVVENRNDGVYILATASKESIDSFIKAINSEAPIASRIDKIETRVAETVSHHGFSIVKSENVSDSVTGVSPDISTCRECLSDMKTQEHRIDYPFINCTNCGPRFTIIKELPYDRAMTSMEPFEMCDKCRKEYENVEDRRFHAQPVACNICGPHYSVVGSGKESQDINGVIDSIISIIHEGKIVALKGTGGFHLVCDASNEQAVDRLRLRKGREGKPLAVMCPDLDGAEQIAHINSEEKDLLQSWQRPIVLLKSKDKLAKSVSNNLNSVGVVLPYMPIHYLLFERMRDKTLVFTSANFSEEPVIIDIESGMSQLSECADLIVTYNREIYNRTDDSVAKIIAGRPVILRRARGYTPSSVVSPFNTEGIFAAGSELVNSFAIGKGSEAILSQYIGDLKNDHTLKFYKETYKLLSKLYRFRPELIACDMHPDYLSTRFAEELGANHSLPVIAVQHHHAHIASCMAENQIEGDVIGLSMDGIGLGSDGNIWGGEIMLADYGDFERLFHFDYVPIVGSDRVSEEPWRSGLAYLLKYCNDNSVIADFGKRMRIKESNIELFSAGIDKGINSHLYSSAGRLFDAVAAITGVNTSSTFHAEAPMRLESILEEGENSFYDYSLERDTISFGQTIEQIVENMYDGVSPSIISTRFHNSVVNALVETVGEVAQSSGIKRVVFSGGTFQNSYLTGRLYRALKKYNYDVYLQRTVPPNDGGLALGQIAVAAYRKSKNQII